MELGKPQFFLPLKKGGSVLAKEHIGMEVEEVAKSECRTVMVRIKKYLT
jgi:hypothetical protein